MKITDVKTYNLRYPLVELFADSRGWTFQGIQTPYNPSVDGYIGVPQAPGLGIEINRDVLEQYA